MDLSAITSAYTALKAIKDVGTSLLEAKIDKEAEKRVNEAFENIGTVQDTLFYMREDLLRLQEENRELKEAARVLEEKWSIKEAMVYKAPSYWLKKGDSEDGPFCQKCYDADEKLIRLQGGSNDYWMCKQCNSHYTGPNHKVVGPVVVSSGRKSFWDGY